MGKPKNNVQNLLAAIQQKVPRPSKPESKRQPEPEPKEIEAKKGSGRGNQFWLQDEDRKLIRELYAWLAGQGIRPTDSAIIKAALRMAKPGQELLDAYRGVTARKQN